MVTILLSSLSGSNFWVAPEVYKREFAQCGLEILRAMADTNIHCALAAIAEISGNTITYTAKNKIHIRLRSIGNMEASVD